MTGLSTELIDTVENQQGASAGPVQWRTDRLGRLVPVQRPALVVP